MLVYITALLLRIDPAMHTVSPEICLVLIFYQSLLYPPNCATFVIVQESHIQQWHLQPLNALASVDCNDQRALRRLRDQSRDLVASNRSDLIRSDRFVGQRPQIESNHM